MEPDAGRHPLRLRPLVTSDEQQARLAHDELEREGRVLLHGFTSGASWSDHLRLLAAQQDGDRLPPGWVLVAEVDGFLVGVVSIRHHLTPELALVGGHIGYVVRPSMRRRGYATAALRTALPLAHSLGIDPALVTCAEDNLASIAVIERCGGRLVDVGPAPGTGRPTRRYQLATT